MHATVHVRMLARPSWLHKFDEWLRRLGLPVQSVATRDGELHIWLDQGQPESFAIAIRPRASQAPGWATTEQFVVGYGGSHDLDATRERWLWLVVGLIRRIEGRLPTSFDVTEGLFEAGMPPEEQFLRLFPFCAVERSSVGSDAVVEVLVRATSKCNQNCPFCSAPDQVTPTHRALLDALARAAETFPGAMVSLTGGEPTLRAQFADELTSCLELGAIRLVQVQTNAVAFASKLNPCLWPPSDRLMFFVSLHATDDSIYDKSTGTHGQLPLALAGIRRMIDAEHQVTLNCVVNCENIQHLTAYVQSLPSLLPRSENVDLHFSSLICHDRTPKAAAFLVRYTDLARALEQAASLATSLGIRIQSLLSSTHASLPACVLSRSYQTLAPHRPTVRKEETGYEDLHKPWIKACRCKDCSLADHCLGVPRAYAHRFGLDELTPIRER